MKMSTGTPDLGQPTLRSYDMDVLYERIGIDLNLLVDAVKRRALTPPSVVDDLATALDFFVEKFALDV